MNITAIRAFDPTGSRFAVTTDRVYAATVAHTVSFTYMGTYNPMFFHDHLRGVIGRVAPIKDRGGNNTMLSLAAYALERYEAGDYEEMVDNRWSRPKTSD